MGFQKGNKLSPPPPKRYKGDSFVTYCRARRAAQLYVFGFDQDDIARLLGCSTRTVRNHLAIPEIRNRVSTMIEESDRLLVVLQFVSKATGFRTAEMNLDILEKSLRGSEGEGQGKLCLCGLRPDSEL